MFLAAVLAETFEEYHFDFALAAEAGRLLHGALTQHGYRLVPTDPSAPLASIRNAVETIRLQQQWIAEEQPVMHLALTARLEQIEDAVEELR